jgi:hypothetical protein
MRHLSMNLPMPAIARVETGSLTPTLSRRERVSRPSLRDMTEPRPSDPSYRPTPSLALRYPRGMFSFSLREKAGMRASRHRLPRFMVRLQLGRTQRPLQQRLLPLSERKF